MYFKFDLNVFIKKKLEKKKKNLFFFFFFENQDGKILLAKATQISHVYRV